MRPPPNGLNPQAQKFKQAMIAELALWIEQQSTQAHAAELLNTTPQRIGKMVRGDTYGFSIDLLIELLNLIGKTVTLEIKS